MTCRSIAFFCVVSSAVPSLGQSPAWQRVNQVFLDALQRQPVHVQAVLEPWVDRDKDLRHVVQRALADVKADDIEPSEAGYWLTVFYVAERWEDLRTLADRAAEHGGKGSSSSACATTALEAALRLSDGSDARKRCEALMRNDSSEAVTVTQNYADRVARLVWAQQGPEESTRFLEAVKDSLARVKPEPGFEYALGLAKSIPSRTLGALCLESGDKKRALATFAAVLKDTSLPSFILREVRAERTRCELTGSKAPAFTSLYHQGPIASSRELAGKVAILEFHGGGGDFPSIGFAPQFRSKLAEWQKTGAAFVRAVWRQTNIVGWIGLDAKDEFDIQKPREPDMAVLVSLDVVKSYGLTGPGAVAVDRDGKVRAYLTRYSREDLEAFMAAVDRLVLSNAR